MQLKYFTSAVSAVLALVLVPAVHAQQPAPTPVSGYIRFWNMLPRTSGAFDLRKIGAPPAESVLAVNATAYRYSNYAALAPGRYRVGVYKAHDDKTPLKVFDVNLTPNSFFTVLIAPKAYELINDAVDPKNPSGTVTFRNYYPGATVTISDGEKPLSAAVPYGESFQATNVALTGSRLSLQARLPNGKTANFTPQPDFKSSKRATVLIIPDSYGDFSPRVTSDGRNI